MRDGTFDLPEGAFGVRDGTFDLRDGTSARPEMPGVDGVLRGWSAAGWPDSELERYGVALFEGLYTAMQQERAAASRLPARRRNGPT